jgi:hypothetical protein
VYDAGALIQGERSNRRFWAEHRIRLELGVVPSVSAAVLAQVSRSSRQVQLIRLLRGCEVVALDEARAHAAGALLAKSRTRDIADAAVVELAASRRADIVTSDRADIVHLVSAARATLRVVAP